MAMASPVRGLRPWRAGRLFVVNVPQPAMETGSPLARLSPTATKTTATIRSAEVLSRVTGECHHRVERRHPEPRGELAHPDHRIAFASEQQINC